MFAFAALPIIVLFTVAGTTGTHFDHPWQWATTGILSWCSTLPFTLYGLAAALWLRSESATGIAAGSLVILAFFGGVFMPLSGTLFDLSRFTPFYGPVTIAHWPHMTGHYYAADGHLVTTESFAFALTATLAWTIMFATVCVIGARQSTQR